MGTVQKRGKAWRAQVALKGIRKSVTRDTKLEALQWIEETEKSILAGKNLNASSRTFGELCEKYAKEVSPKKKSGWWEEKRVRAVCGMKIASVPLSELDAGHVARWRDERLLSVSDGTVRRDWNLLSSICTTAVKEWKLLEHNPFVEAKKPKEPPSRDRLITQDEIDRIMFVLGENPETVTGRVGLAFLFALETGMRQGEICAIRKDDVSRERRFLRIRGEERGAGKTQAARRDVPLSDKALSILDAVGNDFRLTGSQVDALFRKAKGKALVEGITFHDARHYAITQLAKKLNVLELARMVGHRDLKMLQRYFNPTAEELAKKL